MATAFETEFRKYVEIGIERGWIHRPETFALRTVTPWQDLRSPEPPSRTVLGDEPDEDQAGPV